jgi:gliding motility-associated-like protein
MSIRNGYMMKRSLVRYLSTFIFFSFILVNFNYLISQVNSFNLSVRNILQTASDRFEFDIFILDADPSQSFELSEYQMGIMFNSRIITTGDINVTVNNSNSGLLPAQRISVNPQAGLNTGLNNRGQISIPGPARADRGEGTIISSTGNGTLMTRVTVTGAANFRSNTTVDLEFSSSNPANTLVYPTRISQNIGNSSNSIPVIPGTSANVYGNLELNQTDDEPEDFDVTGGGSYCAGSPGVSVGLSDSELGVSYRLFRNGTATSTVVPGTGSAISFGAQTAGTYTVTGTNESGTSLMNESAVVTEVALPAVPSHTTDCSSGSAIVTVTSPLGNGLAYSLDGGNFQTGTAFSDVSNGSHTLSVRNEAGCITTGPSFEVACGCVNGPSLSLAGSGTTTCVSNPVTVTGNTFGGSATRVSIEADGDGSVSPGSATSSPFSFTYTPDEDDAGNTVTITVTTNNPEGEPCEPATSTYTITVADLPSSPSIGAITQPTCIQPTGSVTLNGLPSGTWTLTRNPGGITSTGTGSSTTVGGLPPGTYTFSVANSAGCTSSASSPVEINSPPDAPSSPSVSVNCGQGAGNAVVTVTSPLGSGLEYSIDGGSYQGSATFSGISNGSHYISVRNASGCITTGPSFDVNCGCANGPVVSLGTTTGTTCVNNPVTINGNTFGGSATSVTITENGNGSVSPSSTSSSPFSFTYTPSPGDAGRTVIITVTTNNPQGAPCSPAVAEYALTVTAVLAAPLIGSVTQPDCDTQYGSVVLSGLPSGSWTITRSPGGNTVNGSGSTYVFSNLTEGTHTFTVTSSGCASAASSPVTIIQPLIPSPPLTGNIVQPTTQTPTGAVTLTGLPSGSWTVNSNPAGLTRTGSGNSVSITGIQPGTYTFSVTASSGCTSDESAPVTINPRPGDPVVVINDPEPVCAPSTADLTAPAVTSGSDPGLTFDYWSDINATISLTNPEAVSEGTYFIRGSTSSGSFTIRPVTVIVDEVPEANAGPDQVLENTFRAQMDADIPVIGTGSWTFVSGSGIIENTSDPKTNVSALPIGVTTLRWIVANGVCPPASDEVRITIAQLTIPSLITPNMDGRNDFFIIRGIENLGKCEIVVLDRRGVEVYSNNNYQNEWNGIDYNGNDLIDDTYFYLIKTSNGSSLSGFIVIKR